MIGEPISQVRNVEIGQRLLWVVETLYRRHLDACYHFEIASVTQLRKYLVGKNKPCANVLESICRQGVSVDWLLCGVGTFHNDSPAGHALRDRCAAAGITPPAELSTGAQA